MEQKYSLNLSGHDTLLLWGKRLQNQTKHDFCVGGGALLGTMCDESMKNHSSFGEVCRLHLSFEQSIFENLS